MIAIGKQFALVAAFLAGQATAIAADITPPTDQRSPRGVAEYADEFSEAKLVEKPLIEWMHPFTQQIARGSFDNMGMGVRMRDAVAGTRPKAYLESEIDLTPTQPTAVELLIEQGYGSGMGTARVESSPVNLHPDISFHLAY